VTNPFDWSYLTRVPKGLEAYGPFAIAFVAVFAIGLIASLVVGRWLTRHYRDHALHRRLTRVASQVAAWIFGIGLTFFALRALEVPLLGMRLWLWLCVVALAIALVLAVVYRLWRYPAALAAYEHEQTRAQYLRSVPVPKQRRTSASRRRR
jgi:hypothetical protein